MRVLIRATVCLAAAGFCVACEQGATPAGAGDARGNAAAAAAAKGEAATPETSAAQWREVTIPAGTTLAVSLDTAIASDTSRVEDPVRAHVTRAVVLEGVTALPEGSRVAGVVTHAERAGKVEGTSRLAMRFDSLTPFESDERYPIQTSTISRSGPTQKKKDALQIAAPAAGGAIVGGIVGGKKGAVIGGAAGGGAGTAVVMTQRGKDVRLGPGAALTLRLAEPVTIKVKI